MLDVLLEHINRIYGLELEVDIQQFMIEKETCLRLSGEAPGGAVVIKQDDRQEEIQVGLYIGEETLSRLADLELSKGLTTEKLVPLCTAIEEVSHFAYLFWNVSRGKPVTQLELELQGEVDKFITALLLVARDNHGRVPSDLIDRIFGGRELRHGLDESRRARYEAASAFARSYCFALMRRYLRGQRMKDLLVDLRHFYRLSQVGKIGHIYRTVYAA